MTRPTPLCLALCRELKAAGFPQDDTEFAYYAQGQHYSCDQLIPEGTPYRIPNTGADCSFPWQRLAACPNSDELLAVLPLLTDCGRYCEIGTSVEVKMVGMTRIVTWHARYTGSSIKASGESQNEALARLFLALNPMQEGATP